MVTAFEERKMNAFYVQQEFIYNNNNNKQGFTPNGINNEF